MRLSPPNSVRTVALVAGFCALGIVAGCGQQTFDLLSDQSVAGGGRTPSSNSSAGAGAGNGGNSGSSGSGGKAFGGAGKAELGGFGGRFTPFPLGGGANQPCLGEGGCPDEEPCPIILPFCNPCRTKSDCIATGEARNCDPELKRCVECRTSQQCGMGKICNLSTYRCDWACTGKDSCGFDSFCNQDLGVCVSCVAEGDCSDYGKYSHCAANICVECSENVHCGSQICINGHCIPQDPSP
ncbi:MAG TPA: hypothetical protein VFK05_26480 [Polyangiaceae bacterium]|nr:hypothetical protein [Polyangiaceae bacterium]